MVLEPKLKETHMTRKTPLMAIAAGFTVIAMSGLFASSQASARTLADCKANSRSKVIECCQAVVKTQKPLWMIQTRQSCGSAASCAVKTIPGTSITHLSKPKKVVICSIVKKDPPNNNDRPPPDKPTPNNPDPQRPNPNNPNPSTPGKP
jgi:hypothetical protein